MSKDKDITSVAAKQRHLHLLEKVRGNQALSAAELVELERYESDEKVVLDLGKSLLKETARFAGKYLISQAFSKRLGYISENLADADTIADTAIPLSEIFKRNPKAEQAFGKGQFLRNLKSLASVVETVSEAARKLGLSSGAELRELIDTDPEVGDLWNQTRLNTKIAAREALLGAAKDGNQAAIRVVENYLKDDAKVPAGPDMHHLSQKQVADLFDVDRITVRNWEIRDKLLRNSDGSYDLYAVLKWYKDYMARKSGAGAPAADTLRDMKAEQMKLDLAERKGQLLVREEVIAGLVARAQSMVSAFNYKRRELASMCHGQTVEGIEDILGRFFAELQRKQLELPDFLELPENAEKLLQQLFEQLQH